MSTFRAFDFSDWTQIDITGPDRAKYLHSFSTNDIKQLKTGTACEAFIPNIKGRILGHVLVLALPESLRLIAVPGAAAALVPHLQKYLLGVEAEITDWTGQLGLGCLVQEGTVPSPLPAQAGEVFLFAVSILNLPTWLVTGPISEVRDFMSCQPTVPGTLEQFHRLRIEAGFPWHGVDISEDHLAQEAARTDRAISFTKGCYLGQEPIARLDAMGHTNKELRGLLIESAHVPAGSSVFAGETQIGVISSAALRNDETVALGMIRTKAAKPGERVSVRTPDGFVSATIYWPRLEPHGVQ